MKRSAVDVQQYAAETPGELEALAKAVAKLGRPELLPLDRSYASLDRLEDYWLLVLDKKAPGARARTRERVARYVGATVIEQAGGRWGPGDDDHDPIAVRGLRAVPAAVVLPHHPVEAVEQWRYSGILRDRTERKDVELQRRTIAELTGDLDATLARLRGDVKTLTGADPGPLGGVPALSRYTPALGLLCKASAPRELRRRVHQALTVAIGHLLQAELGPAEWTVVDEPRDVDFGAWTIFGIRLSNTVERVGNKAPDHLRTSVEKMIANRRGKARAPTKTARKKTTKPRRATKPGARLGKWMVLCSASRALSMKAVLERVAMLSGAKAKLHGQVLVLTVGEGEQEVEVQVGFTKAKVVAAEAAEFAAEYGAERADRDEIAAYDARYEITWNLAESERAFETYYTIAFRLTDAVRGITLDRVEGKFVDACPDP